MINPAIENDLKHMSLNDVNYSDYIKENYIQIPDNATNGDVIIAILKSSKWVRSTRNISLTDEDRIFIEIGSNWWNSPYKAESEE